MPVVDDDQAVRESLRRSLEFNDYVCALTDDAAEAPAGTGGEPRLIHTARGIGYVRNKP